MKTFFEIVRSIAEVAACILLFSHFYPLAHYWSPYPSSEETDKIVEFWLFIVTAIFFSLAAGTNTIIAWKKERLIRKAKFVSVLPIVNAAYTKIHTTMGNDKSTPIDYLGAFNDFCNRLSEAFSNITGRHCHVCIKISNSKTVNGSIVYYAKTISREKRRVNNYVGPTRHSRDRTHSASYLENTDFNEIFNNIENNNAERFFFCNSLPKRQRKKGYLNSSFTFYNMPNTGPEKKTFLKFFNRREKWPLAYKSTMVAPICPSIDDPNSQDPIAGFLCIDSEEVNTFIKQDDIGLLMGCANGLFNAIEEYKKKMAAASKGTH